MKINMESLMTDVVVPINEDLVKKLIKEYGMMAKNTSIIKVGENLDLPMLVKNYWNIDELNKASGETGNKVLEMVDQITDFYKQNGTYKTMKNGKSYINNLQFGWYTFQSWNLQNDKKYAEDEISHRFYFNASFRELPELMESLITIYSKMNEPFYFKVNSAFELGCKDALVLYCSTKQLNNTLNVLSEIEKEKPELVKKLSNPHFLTGNINNWVSYASENKLIKGKSYTSIMAKCCIESFENSVSEWIKENPSYSVEHENEILLLKDYFNGSLKNSNVRDMDVMKNNYYYIYRLGHLISVLPEVDPLFIDRIIDNLKKSVKKYNILSENICFNSDVLTEMIDLNIRRNKVSS